MTTARRAALALVLVTLTAAAGAGERILRYDAAIRVAADAGVTVTENLTVRAKGDRIRRGIYRDLPTDYEDRLGNRVRIVPELLSVRRDGAPEPHHTERRGRDLRLYVGSREVSLSPGEYTYEIVYRLQRVLGYFDERDELYWNVTGNEWQFPIEAASATVALPASVPADRVGVEAYTGTYGARGAAYRAWVDPDGVAHVETTRALAPEEGLTVALTWPAGHVYRPGVDENARFLLAQNLGLLTALAGLAATLVYLVLAWRRTGVDPAPGVIFPHYEPPAGYSPASLRYVAEMGYDGRTFTSAVLSLAVKGFLTIEQDGDDYSLAATAKTMDGALAPGERALLRSLFGAAGRLRLDNENHRLVSAAMKAHEKALKRDYYQRYFVTNGRLLLPALVLLAGTGLAAALVDRLTIASVIVLVAGAVAVALFAWLLKAPTPHGRRLLDRAGGFRLYLEVAEKDELRLRNPPARTPELFEAYLPYALALEVEQPWAEQFAGVFAGLREETGASYRPHWYTGRWDAANPVRMAGALGPSLDSAVAAASTPPGSSSGSSGSGFSGGGGGGGGGGGW